MTGRGGGHGSENFPASARVAVVGYASLDSTTSTRAFRGVDATSILDRPLVSADPGVGGIAHLTAAVAGQGVRAEAVSWVGDDDWGRVWKRTVAADGAGITGVATAGTRSPSATLIEVTAGGTICLFDPGDCHRDWLTDAQLGLIGKSDWVLLTVAPRQVTTQVLNVLSESARLAWAVKHDEDAYTPALIQRILRRADVVSFSTGERSYITADHAPEASVGTGSLVVETRGADGMVWSLRSGAGMSPTGAVSVDVVQAQDTTGAGDTFVGALVGLLCRGRPLHTRTPPDITAVLAAASAAPAGLLRRRMHSGRSAQAAHQEMQ